MLSKAIPGLKIYLKKNPNSTRYFVQGKGEIKFTRNDFKAQGGEGAIYVKGGTAYKIYSDPASTITPEKIAELAVLSEANIIRPLALLLDGRNLPVGYSMNSVENSYALCQLFPRAFRQRNNLDVNMTLKLVRRLQNGVAHVHSKGILIVDLNELNFLVSTDFREVFFIDVDSYQTPSFPATVLMESIRDRHSKNFSTNTDWFSFAIVSFQMFTSIHPFKGTFPPLQHLSDAASKLNARMLTNISVLNNEVTVPMSCLPFSVIPAAYLDWYRAVFEEGKRLPPPRHVQQQLTVPSAVVTQRAIIGSSLAFTRLREFDSQILSHDGPITITEKSIYFDGRSYPRPLFDLKVIVSPRRRHLIAAYVESKKLHFRDLTEGLDIESDVKAEELAISGGQLFIKQADGIFGIDLIELRDRVLIGIKPIANVMMRATRMFEGIAIQSMLGAAYASILVNAGKAYQVRLPELDCHQIVDARLERTVLIVVVVESGSYNKHIYRFSKEYDAYDVRVVRDVSSTAIEFTVLDSGIVLHLAEENNLEVFSSVRGSTGIRTVADSALFGDVKLFHSGTQALIARAAELYRVSLR